ncbi:MAG: monovalent cation/H(+) antiporter subunit G [Candidatus Tectomicrobia bacterium]|uniref:Monovalent cation/H(+) antiporter subunit G n=1 Tax=Tectimicrobiota bacterium TaxID=2528274 RepID=A0A937W415_UNCTE|nr:monovalent cation/H(+) antiporter subunit G [Candidatus Tectomicrobia bacterium]
MMVLADILLVIGLLFILTGGIGIVRLPDFYTRLHAMGKCDTLGVMLVLVALAIYVGPSFASVKILLIMVCIGAANPTATHALGRAALQAGLVPWERGKES